MSAIGRRLAALEASDRSRQWKYHRVIVESAWSQEEQDSAIDRQLAEQDVNRDDPDLALIVRVILPAPAAA